MHAARTAAIGDRGVGPAGLAPKAVARLSPARVLTVLDAGLGYASQVMNALGGCLILLIMLIISADICGRYFLGRPLAGTPEMVAMSIAAIVFLQFPNTLRARRVISADGLLGWIGTRSIAAEQYLHAAFHLCGAAMFAIVCAYVGQLLVKSYELEDYYGTVALVTFPRWPVIAIITLGCAVMSVQYLVLAIQFLHAASRGRRLFPDIDIATKVVS